MNEIAKILRSAFRRYYASHRVPPPPEISSREFGVGDYGRKIVTRHLAFPNARALWTYLSENAPLYISYSVGYFDRPSATPMEAKGLRGADLIFEFDADELGISSPNDVVIEGKTVLFPDEKREEALKQEVDTLVKDFLVGDLGVKRSDILINFSGNRGYHIHVRSEELRTLSKEARMEIVEYITGQALDPKYLFDLHSVAEGKIRGPRPSDPGWPGRVARFVVQALREGRIKVRGPAEAFAESIERGIWPVMGDVLASLRRWVEEARKASPYMGKEIDVGTSVDIHRLIRLPDSLHGGTGLAAAIVDNIWAFDPYRDAVALPETPTLEIYVIKAPEFMLGGEWFGPYENQKVELPLFASIFLLGKGVARWR